MQSRPIGHGRQHVAVIGAGIVGLAVAQQLVSRGIRVTVLDRSPRAEASWGNPGWITPALMLPSGEPSPFAQGLRGLLSPTSAVYASPTLDPRQIKFILDFARHRGRGTSGADLLAFTAMNELMVDSWERLDQESLGGEILERGPFVLAFASIAARDAHVMKLEAAVAAGNRISWSTPTVGELHDGEPALSPGVAAGIVLDGQRHVDPGAALDRLRTSIVASGGTVRTDVDVRHLRPRASGVDVVATDGQIIDADAVVVATGARLNRLIKRFGVRTSVGPGRGYSFAVRPETVPAGPVYFPAERIACTPMGDRLRVGGSMEFARQDAPIDPRRIERIARTVAPFFDGVDVEDRTEEWVGSRPCSVDNLPLVGRTHEERVLVAGGHGRWGVALAPLTATLIADLLTGGAEHELLPLLAPLRAN